MAFSWLINGCDPSYLHQVGAHPLSTSIIAYSDPIDLEIYVRWDRIGQVDTVDASEIQQTTQLREQ